MLGLTLAACSSNKSSDTTVAAAVTPADTGTAAPADSTATVDTATAVDTTGGAETTAAAASPVAMSAECATDKLKLKTAGTLTVGTDKPAYAPWFSDDDPSNGKGFESALTYAVAEKLGFTKEQVKWTTVPFNSSYAPGSKNFDFDVNQVSITDDRKKVVDFSDGYYEVNQAIVALNDSPAAGATTVAELAKFKFGAQVGTTSLQFITDVVKPSAQPFVYDDTNAAKAALVSKQIDAIVVDLPTAFYITAAEIENSKVVGQFPAQGGGEQFGLLFEKDSPLTPCVNEALAALRSSGRLAEIQNNELATATNAPILK
jgi:polar amino acid transport system substrate-binding protein